jgi:hypothetical protein
MNRWHGCKTIHKTTLNPRKLQVGLTVEIGYTLEPHALDLSNFNCHMTDDTKSKLMNALWAGRLAVFCGAGLSMGPPSTVPNAARLADQCANAYEESSGTLLPADLHWNIEALAEFFASRHELENIFLADVMQRVPDYGTFFRNHNAGHEAVADFLACHAIEIAISTNVDDLIEHAAETLGEPRGNVAVSRAEVNDPSPHNPHVKLHGCFRRNRNETLWCTSQLTSGPFDERIREFTDWLPGVLHGRDLVFVGFWSDWSYFNKVLGDVLAQSRASRIVLVNPSPAIDLQTKAQGLWDLAQRPGVEFIHEQQFGQDFLDELRQAYSSHFMRRLIASGAATFRTRTGRDAPAVLGFEQLSSRELYEWRQDSTATPSSRIVRKKEPDEFMRRLGATHLEMLDAGALVEGSSYSRSGRKVRLIHGAGRLIGDIRSDYSRSSSLTSDDLVVCVGAENTEPLPDSVARGNGSDSFVRPGLSGTWINEIEAREIFTELEQEPNILPLAAEGTD